VLSLARDVSLGFLCCALSGFGLVLFNATSQSVVQLSTDEHNRGRVLAVWSIIICGALWLGYQLVGPAADVWDVPSVLRLQGAGCLAAAVGVLALFAVWRRARGDQ
jgi:hypothetical protein